jgi:hypothetical protein
MRFRDLTIVGAVIFSEYLALPLNQRENRFGWYHAMQWSHYDVNRYLKKQYPVQYFFRSTIPNFIDYARWGLMELTVDIREFFFPRQRWLTGKIPNHWCDKVELLPILIFESLIHYVEVEQGLDSRDWNVDVHGNSLAELTEAYRYAKTIRHRLKKKYKGDDSANWLFYEKLQLKLDQRYMLYVIKNLQYLWT